MAKLIVKSPYIKGNAGGYLKYIGTRDGVELLDQQAGGYMEYMAQRPRSHGLFGDENSVDMAAAMKELNDYPGNIWTHIISLKREDAERLGYDHAQAWRNLLRAHRNEIAKAMRIPPQDFRWYAAFHDEGDHPHVHMMAWSVKPGQAYLSKSGIEKIKSALTNDIFKQEMLHLYEQKSATRDDLVRESRKALRDLAREMQSGICIHPEVEELMAALSSQLKMVKGKTSYGYLPKKVKATVNEIVDQMEQITEVHEYYERWWELQCQLEDLYSEKQRKRPPLSEQKEFRHIKNAVIQEAEHLNVITFEDEDMEAVDEDDSLLPDDGWELWLVTQDETVPMAEREAAAEEMESRAKGGDTYSWYRLGKLWRDGPVLIPDWVNARYCFEQAARRGYTPAQYALGKLFLSHDPEIHDPQLGIQWLEYAARNGSSHAAYQLGKEYLRGEIVAKDKHKAVDFLSRSAKAGNQYAQYTLGKLCLEKQDREQALYWFRQSASQGHAYAQFFLDRWESLNPPSAMLSVTRLLYHMGRIFQDRVPPPAIPGGIRIDRKHLAQIREKKIALGQKPDDHEDYVDDFYNGPTMSM